MWKNVVKRCLLGAPIGVMISTLITICISYAIGDGVFYPVVPELAESMGSEINAVMFQFCLSLLYGALCAGASAVWEVERWSLLRQTVIHFLIISVAMLPVAYFTRWMSHDVPGVLRYFGIFIGVYVLIWAAQYFPMKYRVKKLNEGIKK